jgi:hypothetical protein
MILFLNNMEINACHLENILSRTLKPDTNLGWEYNPKVISIARPRKRSWN